MHRIPQPSRFFILLSLLLFSCLLLPRGAECARGKKSPRWRYIVIHHSATRKGNAFIMGRYHRNRRNMPNGLAYHFVINNGTAGTKDGEVEVGSRWTQQIHGGHVKQQWLNDCGIGICLVGNFNKQSPTREQMKSLVTLVNRLRNTYGIPLECIKGHKDCAGERTLCPGKNFPMKQFKDSLRKSS